MYSPGSHRRKVTSIACSAPRSEPGAREFPRDRVHRLLAYAARTATVAATLLLAGAGTIRAQQSVESEVLLPAPIPLLLLDSLSLTTEQRTQITAALESRKPTFDAILDRVRTSDGATDADRVALRAFVDDRNAAIRAALTADQRARLDQLIARME